ncbi:MAG: Uma2 family endonuclease [Oscillospiraceae bacterium]|nr:Uma2 family endonuclease [Oscillospiraceae bacterium]
MTIEEMKMRKRELGYSNEQISALSGVPLGTVIKVFGGATRSPRRSTIQALERVLGDPQMITYHAERRESGVHEPSNAFGAAIHNKHTVDDYYQLPDDVRVELIDGQFYDMTAPSYKHQAMLLELAVQFREYVRSHPGQCFVFMAPCDVQICKDSYTMVQPDLIVVCDRTKIKKNVCYGAPDLVLEVMSPSSRSHDSVRKLNLYRQAGVREYWLIDPEEQKVLVYDFGEDSRFRLYGFTEKVPVGISGGDCSIDLAEAAQAMIW